MAEFAFEYWNRVWEKLGEQRKSLKDLSEGVAVSYGVMRQYKTRNRYPKTDVQIKIANYLGTTVEYLMTGKEPEKVPVNDDYTYIVKMLKDDPALASSIANLIKSIRGEK